MAQLLIYPRAGVSNYGLSHPVHKETIEPGTKLTVTEKTGGTEFAWDDRTILTNLPFLLVD